MQKPTSQELFDTLDATWPAKQFINHAGWMIREGAGGGQRVSATTLEAPLKNVDIAVAERKMQDLRQKELFMVRGSDTGLDAILKSADYGIVDPVVVLVSPVNDLLKHKHTVHPTTQSGTPNTDAQVIWAAGGIGPSRLAIMERATTPKAIIQSRDMGVALNKFR